jgi:parvulin-like peptidyl-prolyl isomerase
MRTTHKTAIPCACLKVLIPAVLLLLSAAPTVLGTELPLVEGKPTVAVINGEPITLDEFYRELAARHSTMEAPTGPVTRRDPSTVLEELIDTRLILQEARNIGLHELPEVAQALGVFRRDTLRDVLLLKHVGVISEPDPDAVERLYRDAVAEASMVSVFMDSEEDARALRAKVDAGGDFEQLAAELVAAGKGTGGERSPSVRLDTLLPQIREALWALEPGEVSQTLAAGRGYALVQLIERNVPDVPAERAKAESTVKQRYTRVNQEVLDSIDYKANGIDAYLEDSRVIGEVEGGEPLTVAVLTQRVKEKYFHGVEGAIEKGKADEQKLQMLDDVLRRRAVLVEARKLKIEEVEEYVEQVTGFENRVLFGTFVQKAIDPDLKIDEADLSAYLEAHGEDYLSPGMVRLESLVFEGRAAAESALELLRRGSAMSWVRDNAEGRLDPEGDETLFRFPRKLVVLEGLPDGVREAVGSARPGEYRLFAEPDGPGYVIRVAERVDPQPLPLDRVRADIRERVVMEKRRAAVDDWAAKLREVSEIEVFATGDALREVLGLSVAASE